MKDLLRRWLRANGGRIGVAAFLDAVNAELLGDVGEHLLIGPSHFMRRDLRDHVLERIWTYNVFPLLEEQFWGDVQKVDKWRWGGSAATFRDRTGRRYGCRWRLIHWSWCSRSTRSVTSI